MKTTIDIADRLGAEARRVAAREGTTLRALVEEGLRRVLDARKQTRPHPFRWEPVGHGGRGLRPGIREGDWEGVRARIYEGHGG